MHRMSYSSRMGQCFAGEGRRTVNEAKLTGTTTCWFSLASLTSEGTDFNQVHKVFCIISISPFSKQPVQFQALHMGHFSARQCRVQSKLEMLFHWHQELNLVQRWLHNLKSNLSSPLSVASFVHKAAWPVSAIAQQKTNREGRKDLDFLGYLQTGFGFLGLPTNWFLKHQWGWQCWNTFLSLKNRKQDDKLD